MSNTPLLLSWPKYKTRKVACKTAKINQRLDWLLRKSFLKKMKSGRVEKKSGDYFRKYRQRVQVQITPDRF